MSFNKFTEGLNERFQQLSTTVSGKAQEFSHGIPTTHRYMQEKLGHATDISEMPHEYIELASKVDAIKMTYDHFLQVTQVYDNESYDYPKHINESINEFSKSVGSKIQDLSHASSAHEAHNILSAPGPSKDPKTLNYALSRVSLVSSECMEHLSTHDDALLASHLMKYSDTQSRVAQARLHQDILIQTHFNERLRADIDGNLKRASKVRKDVENKRLTYDAARAHLEKAKPEKEAQLRVHMETAEEEFAQTTENAIVVMQEVVASTDFMSLLRELAAAQLSYHEAAAERMQEFLSHFPKDDGETKASSGQQNVGLPPSNTKTAGTTPLQSTSNARSGIALSDEAEDQAAEATEEKPLL